MIEPLARPITLPKYPWANDNVITAFPRRVDLDIEVVGRRQFPGYELLKLAFTSESPVGLPDPSLARVPAYLLIPNEPRFTPPCAAVVALHQCGRDCDIGKDAVIGNAVERPDQAYGLELVQQGFVVIVPESINCGERIIRQLREAGAPPHSWTHANCWNGLHRFVPWGTYRAKRVWDGIRAIDAICSFPFTDPSRIAVVGHSMGSGTGMDVLIADPRIKAGILSPGGCSDEQRALAAPKLLIQEQCVLDTTAADLARIPQAQGHVRAAYVAAGASPDLCFHQTLEAGHHFHDDFKVEAFARLRAFFGMIRVGERISLAAALRDVLARLERREDLWWSWPTTRQGSKLPEIKLLADPDAMITADHEELLLGLEKLIIPVSQKIPHGSHLSITAKAHPVAPAIDLAIPGGQPVPVAHEFLIRQARHHLAGCGGRMTVRHAHDALSYGVTFGHKP